jgi:hypothetical protein
VAISSLTDLPGKARDAFYVAVGFSVIAADRIKGRRHELEGRLGVELSDIRERLTDADRSPHS